MKYIYALILLAVFSLSACAPACDVESYTSAVDPIVSRWQDAVTVADQTPRMSLSAQINELQSIKRDADAVEVSECLAVAHDSLLSHMEFSIEGYLAFLGEQEDTMIQVLFDNAEHQLKTYQDELAKVNE